MKVSPSRVAFFFVLAALLAAFAACTNRDNPDEIRQRTADATAAMRRDTKAVVEGLKEGMGRDKAVDVNHASREELLNLPGITQHEADRIVAEAHSMMPTTWSDATCSQKPNMKKFATA
jgi:hypothetical protein